jgi:hypothetical protein
VRQAFGVMDLAESRSCSGCGRTYNFLDRGARGPLHFHVVSVDEEGETIRLVGHWRSGVWPAAGPFRLVRRNRESAEVHVSALELAAGVAGHRGQATLTVEGTRGEVRAGDCVVEDA